ncbi:phosphoglucosamine mutase [Ammonifex thiophilus]|uniref:Phosphoglucosamine mutase n=1 Tax=Ammonifex thiophilus TaxID=444093 RepID=A0A3D8P4V7_9THEO|nr:phosphoglucosamine mutase [Ammonifex thiophilus]RDV84270.1 phosphoglucosamine mutase [Ammonifex thiophilus]
MGVLFGTDGVRGVANRELTPELAFRLGRAGAFVLAEKTGKKTILVGRDTRASGDMLEAALVAGITSAGLNVCLLGVLPTPAVAFLTRARGAAGGIVISASHNPAEDNGIKFFGPDGYKLPDALEEEIENLVLGSMERIPSPTGTGVGRAYSCAEAVEEYLEHVRRIGPPGLKGMKIAVDCAHGAAYALAPTLLEGLGAKVIPLGVEPDGHNINDGCGSTKPHRLSLLVKETGADLGLAFDGDADRLIGVDGRGEVADGDVVIWGCARYLKSHRRLKENTVVVTVMSNLGLKRALQAESIRVLETRVGDRYVLEAMLKSGACLGGEQSGHIIFLDHNTTGDGLITAMMLLRLLVETGQRLEDLNRSLVRYPQLLENVRVRDKGRVMQSPKLLAAIEAEKIRLGEEGRVLVRPSGTEPVIRVMVEALDPEKARSVLDSLVDVIREIEEGGELAAAAQGSWG